MTDRLERLDRPRVVEVHHGVELAVESRPEIVADPLGLRAIDHPDGAAGWMVMFGSRGLLNTVLDAAGLIHQPVQFMYTEVAVIVGIAAVNLPFMVLAL